MKTITSENIIEDSRTTMHEADVKQIEDFVKHSVSKSEFAEHCKSNNANFISTNEKLDKLLPLVNLIPLIQTTYDEKRAYTIVASKIIKIVGIATAIIVLILGAINLMKEIKK